MRMCGIAAATGVSVVSFTLVLTTAAAAHGYVAAPAAKSQPVMQPKPPPVQRREAHSGGVNAVVSFRELRGPRPRSVRRMRLVIRRDTTLVVNQAISSPPNCGDTIPVPLGRLRSLAVAELDGNTEPEVILTLSCGGAHGRAYSYVFTYTSQRSYQRTLQWWHEFNPRVSDLDGDGIPEFTTADERFSYAFTSFAESGNPIRVWSLRSGVFSEVTHSFPAVVARDRDYWWKAYLKSRGNRTSDVRGYLSAYMADEYVLGQEDAGWSNLRTAVTRGDINRPNLDPPTGDDYLTALAVFLSDKGYDGS
jgi:hypothetical protein